MRFPKLVLIAGLLLIATLPPSARADLLWGVNGHPFTAYPGIPYKQQLELVKELGMRSYRVNISVPSQAPMLAKLVSDAKPLGIEILPVLTPALNLKTETAEQLYSRAYRMAVALISQFKGDIRVWELGNELENFAIIKACEMRDNGEQYNCNWGPAGGVSPLDYYGPRWAKVSAVLKGLSDGTISVDPTIRKAMGTAGWGHVGAFERMQRDGIEWDISVWHMYGDNPEWAFKKLATYNRPIWVTEFNNPLGSQRSEEEQVSGLVKQMTRLRELQKVYDVEAAHIYELLDETYWAPDYEAFMGLVRLEKNGAGGWRLGGPKPAYSVVQQLIRGGSEVVQEPTTEKATRASTGSFHRDGCELNRLEDQRPITAEVKAEYAFCLILDRPADGGGLMGWADSIERGRSGDEVALAMLQSDEFARAHTTADLADPAFVGLIYRLLLDRNPDGGGLSKYVGELGRGEASREDVAKSIITSGEFKSKHPILFAPGARPVARSKLKERNCERIATEGEDVNARMQAAYAYCLVFGRDADPTTLETWTAGLSRGTPPLAMLSSLLSSDDFNRQFSTAKLGTTEFVSLIYDLLLGRQPDVAGLSAYASLLERGALTRTGFAKALMESSEFRSKRPLLFWADKASGKAPPHAQPQ